MDVGGGVRDGVNVAVGVRVCVTVGVRVIVGVRVMVGVRVIVAVGEGVAEGGVVGVAVGGSPETVNRPETPVHSNPTNNCTSYSPGCHISGLAGVHSEYP